MQPPRFASERAPRRWPRSRFPPRAFRKRAAHRSPGGGARDAAALPRAARGDPTQSVAAEVAHVLSVPFIHRRQRGPSGHFTSLHFTTRGRNKTARPRGRRRGVERPAVPERRRGGRLSPHGRSRTRAGPGPFPGGSRGSCSRGPGGRAEERRGRRWRPGRRRRRRRRAAARPAGVPAPQGAPQARTPSPPPPPPPVAPRISAPEPPQCRRRPLKKRMWSARQVLASCGRRPWRGLRKRRLRLAALLRLDFRFSLRPVAADTMPGTFEPHDPRWPPLGFLAASGCRK